MNKYILSVALIVVFYGSECLAAKKNCDLMKDFQPEFNDIKGWGEERCKSNPTLRQADLDAASKGYDQFLKGHLTSANGKKVDAFVIKHVFISATLGVCSKEEEQKRIKDAGMKDVGMQTGMKLKKEVEEGDCAAFKKAFQEFNAYVKSHG